MRVITLNIFFKVLKENELSFVLFDEYLNEVDDFPGVIDTCVLMCAPLNDRTLETEVSCENAETAERLLKKLTVDLKEFSFPDEAICRVEILTDGNVDKKVTIFSKESKKHPIGVSKDKSILPYPEHINYLQNLAQSSFSVGNGEHWNVFTDSGELNSYWKGISDTLKSEYQQIYDEIVKKNDSPWIFEWIKGYSGEDEDLHRQRDQVLYLLQLLDLLVEEKLIVGDKELAPWDDYELTPDE